jgi:hypothetical protein
MAEQIISPGVFTRENDLSFLPQGVGQIGAAIIGPTEQGCAFIPTVVRSFAEYERKFGTLNSETFVPQTVREYLKNAGSVTVCRVLGGGGYTFSTGNIEPIAILASGSDATTEPNRVILGIIYPSKNTATSTPSLSSSTLSAPSITGSQTFTLQGTGITTNAISVSFDPTESNYLFKQLGDSPNNSKNGVVTYEGDLGGYTYINFKSLQSSLQGTDNITG